MLIEAKAIDVTYFAECAHFYGFAKKSKIIPDKILEVLGNFIPLTKYKTTRRRKNIILVVAL